MLFGSERSHTPTHNYLTPPHSYSPNVFERHLIFVKTSSNFCSGRRRHLTQDIFPRLFARRFEKRLSHIPIRYQRKQQKIIIDNEASTTGFTKIQPTLDSNSHKPLFQESPQPFPFTLHANVPLEKKRYISLLLKEWAGSYVYHAWK
jgi:hypothetical protein